MLILQPERLQSLRLRELRALRKRILMWCPERPNNPNISNKECALGRLCPNGNIYLPAWAFLVLIGLVTLDPRNGITLSKKTETACDGATDYLT